MDTKTKALFDPGTTKTLDQIYKAINFQTKQKQHLNDHILFVVPNAIWSVSLKISHYCRLLSIHFRKRNTWKQSKWNRNWSRKLLKVNNGTRRPETIDAASRKLSGNRWPCLRWMSHLLLSKVEAVDHRRRNGISWISSKATVAVAEAIAAACRPIT